MSHGDWEDHSHDQDYRKWVSNFDGHGIGLYAHPEQLRWIPQKFQEGHFHKSIRTMMGSGAPDMKTGLSIAHYSFQQDMTKAKVAMYSSDGDFLIVPQTGTL